MKEFFMSGLFGLLGVSFGVLWKYRPARDKSRERSVPSPHPQTIPKIELDKNTFTTKEINFIQQLIQVTNKEANVSTVSLIDILEIHLLPQTSKRLLCNKFLKSLNLKILVRYGIKDAVLILGSDEDKRKKCYQLNPSFFQLTNQNNSNNAYSIHLDKTYKNENVSN